MGCMKCGKETADNQAFCEECLEEMAAYPVKPGTPVLLPNRPAAPVVRKHRSHKRQRKPEEQLSHQKKWIVFLCAFCCLLMVALTLSVILNIMLLGNEELPILPGQNYNVSQEIGSLFGDTP